MCKHRGESDVRQGDSQSTRWYDRPFFLDSANHVEHMLQDFAIVGDGMAEGDKSVGDKAHPMDVEVGSFFRQATENTAHPRKQVLERLNAKNAKTFELDERSDFTLSHEDATMYRAFTDRPDIGSASEEPC